MKTALFSAHSLTKAFGARTLFKDLSIHIAEGDRIGLIGQNGSGKSTLLKILAGLEVADHGSLSPRRGLKIGYLPQTCECPDQTPIDILLDTLRQTSHAPDYEQQQLAEMWLSKLGFTGNEPSAALLSGGWKKRVCLAKEMILSPDLLLLDEPTNHLDLEGVLWLETFLLREAPTYLLVSHDRYFLQHATCRIVEIDPAYPKGLFAIEGSYSYFLEKKEEFLQGQLSQEHALASRTRREVDWLRSQAKARTTKSQARIDQAHELIQNLTTLHHRNQKRSAGIDFIGSARETRKLLVAKNVSKEMQGRPLFHGLNFTLSPGTRLGLMGPNGSGKTTLLRLLAGDIEPDQGTLKRADALQVVYFDQHRNTLPHDISLRKALAPTGDFILFRNQQIHVNSWCKRFLFSPDILDLPLGTLSGGERARIAIAHLMLQPTDLLLLDEPTNDLDIPTLEALETSLLEFPGAVVLITHDRCMLDRICTSLLALGNPSQTTLFADYSQWQASLTTHDPIPPASNTTHRRSSSKLSYMEKKEYEMIDTKILKLEQDLQTLIHLLETPAIAQNHEKLIQTGQAISLLETHIEQLYLRWEELDQKSRE